MAIDWRNWRSTLPSSGQRSINGGKRRQPYRGGYTTIIMQKPFCCPARDQILTALQPRGVIVGNKSIREHPMATSPRDMAERMKIEFRTLENIKYAGVGLAMYLPFAIQAYVRVRNTQAAWAEYLLAASGRFVIIKGAGTQKEAGYRRNGRLPPTKNGYATVQYVKKESFEQYNVAIEPTCEEGKKAWKDFYKLAEIAQQMQKGLRR